MREFLQQEKLKELLLVASAALVIASVCLLTADPLFYGYPNWKEGYDYMVYLLMAENGISCNVPMRSPRHPSAGAS